jgi:hypothetical protein
MRRLMRPERVERLRPRAVTVNKRSRRRWRKRGRRRRGGSRRRIVLFR